MKKSFLVVLAGAMALSLMGGCSKGYLSQKTVDGMNITLKAERYPLIKGDNALSVIVADSSGKALGDVTVTARYYMPPMPGMAPMEFNAMAQAKGSGYAFTANIPMEGGWKIDVIATQPGKPAAVATFNVDAR